MARGRMRGRTRRRARGRASARVKMQVGCTTSGVHQAEFASTTASTRASEAPVVHERVKLRTFVEMTSYECSWTPGGAPRVVAIEAPLREPTAAYLWTSSQGVV